MRAPEPPDRPGPSTGLAHPADGPLAWALDGVVRGYAGTSDVVSADVADVVSKVSCPGRGKPPNSATTGRQKARIRGRWRF